jgi:NADH-quinone oxidoreductase subunit J
MIGISALFVTLNAYFLAGVQLIVYAGAVTVLFVMVLMLFDLKNELIAFSKGKFSGFVKIASIALFSGIVVGAIVMTAREITKSPPASLATYGGDTTKELGRVLFSKYVFGFEALGILLLVVAIGTVALSRSRGGTHVRR